MAQRVQIILPRRADVLHTECGTDLGTVKEKKKTKTHRLNPSPASTHTAVMSGGQEFAFIADDSTLTTNK